MARLSAGDPFADERIVLSDGRTLAYTEWGARRGRPVFFFHGTPGSRVFVPDPAAASDASIRLIAPDRPGTGASDPQPGHRIADWAEDVTALADALGLGAFGVIGWSGGAPYALACSALAPARVPAVAITSSASSLACLLDDDALLGKQWLDDGDRAILDALRESRASAERVATEENQEWVRSIQSDPGSDLASLTSAGSRRVLADPSNMAGLNRGALEAVRQGSRALAPQFVGLLAPWGFRPEDVDAEVHLWLGDQDEAASPDQMEKLATKIPRHVVTVWEDAGHLAIIERMGEVLAAM